MAAGAAGLDRAWIWLPPSLLVAATALALLVLAGGGAGASRVAASVGEGATP